MSTYAETLRADFKAFPLGAILGSVADINPTSVRQSGELTLMADWSFEIPMAEYDDTFMQTGYYVEFNSVIGGVDTLEFTGWITAFNDTWTLPTVGVNTIRISGKDDLFELAKTTIRFGEIYTPLTVYPLYVGWTQGNFGEGDTYEFTANVTDNDTGTYERFGLFDISTAPSNKQAMLYVGNDAPFTEVEFVLGSEVNTAACNINVQVCHLSTTGGKNFWPPSGGLDTSDITVAGVPFAKSGIISWDKEALEIQETHDGKALYWMRLYMDGFGGSDISTSNIRFAEIKVKAAGPHATDVQEIIDNYAPGGWALHASSETGTQEGYAVSFFNETVLGALFDLAERSGELFALSDSQEIRWIDPAALPSSGIMAVQNTTDGSGSSYCYLRNLTRQREYKDIVTRVYPTGAGDDEVAAVSLFDLEQNPATADWRFDLPTGWTIDPTENYIANTPLETTRTSEGKVPVELPAYEPFPNVAPLRGGAGHNRQTADELAKSAIAFLQKNRQPTAYYTGTVVGLDWEPGLIHPGMTMVVDADVVAQDGTVTEAINDTLVIISYQRSFDSDGTRFFNIKFSTEAIQEPTPTFKSAKRAFKNKQKASYPQSASSSKLYLGVNSGGGGGGGTSTGIPAHGITSIRHTIVSEPGKVVGATDTDQLGLIGFDLTNFAFNNTTNFWNLSSTVTNQLHAQSHVLATTTALGPDHTVSGLTAGQVLKATSATAARFIQLLHSELGSVGADDHHDQVHNITGSDHTIAASTGQLVGATSTNTLGLLTPGSDGRATNTILKSDGDGKITLNALGINTNAVAAANGAITVSTLAYIGLGASAGRIIFLDEATDKIRIADGDLQLNTSGDLIFVTDGSSEIGSSSQRALNVHTDELDLNGVAISSDGSTVVINNSNIVHRQGGTTANYVLQSSLGSVGHSRYTFRASRGGIGAETALSSGDRLGALYWEGYGTSAWGARNAAIEAEATQAFTDANQGTKLIFVATPDGGSPGTKMTLQSGLQVGSPTGGDKGNGTINTSGDIYKSNSAYTNPDYALEMWATGRIVTHRHKPGAAKYKRYTLEEVEAHAIKNHRLPGVSEQPMGMFERADFLLEKVEELYTHIIEQNKTIKQLGARIEVLEREGR